MVRDLRAKEALGWQSVLDLHGCHNPLLDDLDWVRRTLVQAAEIAEATVVADSFHRFAPQGISGVVVIAESHIAIHTWPEENYAAIDVFTCNSRLLVEKAAQFLAAAFQATDVQISNFTRGDRSLSDVLPGVHRPKAA